MEHLAAKGVRLHLGDGLARIEERAGAGLVVVAESCARLPADLVILAIGVRPETMLAKDAGLEIGPRGGIVVDAQMRTCDPNIWAVGDVVEVQDESRLNRSPGARRVSAACKRQLWLVCWD